MRTAVQAPLMNSVCERFLGSVRRECLDHLIILSEPQLQQVLAEYALSYFNTARPHQGIGQRLPLPGDSRPGPSRQHGHGDPRAQRAASRLPRGGVTTADHERSQHQVRKAAR